MLDRLSDKFGPHTSMRLTRIDTNLDGVPVYEGRLPSAAEMSPWLAGFWVLVTLALITELVRDIRTYGVFHPLYVVGLPFPLAPT